MKTRTLTTAWFLVLIAAAAVGGPAGAYDAGLAKTYEQFFASFEEQQTAKALRFMTPEQIVEAIKKGEDIVLLDVRTEREQSLIGLTHPGTLHMPMNEVFKAENLAKIPTGKQVIVTCQSGVRCEVIALALRSIGFENIFSMKGGLAEMMKFLDPKTAF